MAVFFSEQLQQPELTKQRQTKNSRTGLESVYISDNYTRAAAACQPFEADGTH